MNEDKKLNWKSHTSININSLKGSREFLEKILLADDNALQSRKTDKPVILYGAGSLGKMAKEFFDYFKLPVLYGVDKNADQCQLEAFWKNTKIIHPDEVEEADKKNCLLVICVVTTPLIVLRDELKNNGWKDVVFFYDLSEAYRDDHPISNGWFLGKFNEIDKESIGKVFFSLADDVSRAHYVQFLAWRKMRIELLFNQLEINNNNRFFIFEIISLLCENEIFVDCGAHHGSVTKKFLQLVSNKFKAIIAIEPDNINFTKLKENLEGVPNIKLMNCALSDINGHGLFYQGFDFASKLCDVGNDSVRIITLDSLNLPATFIKMHLEGGDLKALKGAIKTIRKHRPIVAVTIYHNADGVWETPFFLMNNTSDYKYYVRLHSWGGTGAVFYAIPAERNNI